MHIDTNSQKLKVDWKVLGGAGLKNKFSQSGLWALKLTVSQEKTNGLNWFFACCYNFTQIKRWLKIFGGEHGQKWVWLVSGWDSKIDLSEEWMDGINLFFACWYMITKIKSWSKIFWVGMVKNWCDKSGHRLKNEQMEYSHVFLLVQIQEN